MKDYKQFSVGDTVIKLASFRTGTVTEVAPSNAYKVQYTDGHTEYAMDWQLASPEDVVYSVIITDYCDDGNSDLRCDTVTRNIEYAKQRVTQLAADWRDFTGNFADQYETEQDDLSFSAWKDGYYNDDHYVVVVKANRLE